MTLKDAIEIYKTFRSYAFLAGVNNVVCLYKQRKWIFDEIVAFGDMESMFIEDFICVYDNELGHLNTCTKEDLLKTMEFHGTHKQIKDCYLYNYDIY